MFTIMCVGNVLVIEDGLASGLCMLSGIMKVVTTIVSAASLHIVLELMWGGDSSLCRFIAMFSSILEM
jgi:hypothetical protein